ncbi:MAG: flagellar biosynthetic protein FliR [Paracoccaceae bacterium]|jgi:flagellar biosynthetic protein FliR
MTDLLSVLGPIAQTLLLTTLVVFFRVGAAMAVLPAFGERTIPQRIRLVLAMSLTVILVPMLDNIPTFPEQAYQLALLMMGETVIGLSFGLVLRLFVMTLQIAGSIAAQSTSLSQIFGGSNMVEPQPAIGHLFVVGGLAIAVLNDLHLKLIEAFLITYEIFPAGTGLTGAALAGWGIKRISYAFALGFTLSAPFMIAAFIYNIALGVINKAMPQLMVTLVGAPAITAAGLGLLLITTPLLLELWRAAMDVALANPFGDL